MSEQQKPSRLENRDYTLIIDQSGSMDTEDCPNGQSRWASAQESTESIARKLNKYDPDGITVVTFNNQYKTYENTTPEKVKDIFAELEPNGGTVLAPVLKSSFDSWLKRKQKGELKANGEIIVVVTDGCPQDEKEVASTIVNFTKKLDQSDEDNKTIGIEFIQVGKDVAASRFLKKLDDDLTSQGAKYDIVDTKTMEEMGNMTLVQVLEAALDD
jgi:uncharacterized protein YegL